MRELEGLRCGEDADDRKNRTANGERPQERWGSTRESNADRQHQSGDNNASTDGASKVRGG
ncbi:hypothetical protein GCM10009655_24540 [Rhodoglobus aureus]|uniref:Uncharacterized protein n=1 Tax=Rhodoglobus aureus TaxID=191497 RepID=A0ABN1VYH6_9MICO